MTSKTVHLAKGTTLPSVLQTANYEQSISNPTTQYRPNGRRDMEDLWRDYYTRLKQVYQGLTGDVWWWWRRWQRNSCSSQGGYAARDIVWWDTAYYGTLTAICALQRELLSRVIQATNNAIVLVVTAKTKIKVFYEGTLRRTLIGTILRDEPVGSLHLPISWRVIIFYSSPNIFRVIKFGHWSSGYTRHGRNEKCIKKIVVRGPRTTDDVLPQVGQ